MDCAKDLHSGYIVAAEDALPAHSYICPRPGCGGRVFLRDGGNRRAHFAHHSGEGTPACDEYFPGSGDGWETVARPVAAAVEEDASELGLVLTQLDGRWGLGLRLPEIPGDELGEISLGVLRSALVDIYAGSDRLLRVSALDLRPGVGTARVDVVPSLQTFRTQPTGSWPASVDKRRWLLDSRGLDAKGALFRLRRGEWMRLVAGSGVHHGETLLVLADARCAPPGSIVAETHAAISGGGLQWTIWEVQLPGEPVAAVLAWLARLGHEFVPRPWSMELATPPRAYSKQGEPVFWVGDTPVLMLEAPRHGAATMVAFKGSSNSHSASVQAAKSRFALVSVSARDAGVARLVVASEPSASVGLAYVQRPSSSALRELLAQTARLRIQIGEQPLEAWQSPTHMVRVPAHEQPKVRVELGAETVRVRVTVWERGKQRSTRGLDSKGASRAIEDALAGAERLEIDAGNLGRAVLLLVRVTADTNRQSKSSDRLAWHDHVAGTGEFTDERRTPTILQRPGAASSYAARQVTPDALVRSRMALRRRIEAGGTRS